MLSHKLRAQDIFCMALQIAMTIRGGIPSFHITETELIFKGRVKINWAVFFQLLRWDVPLKFMREPQRQGCCAVNALRRAPHCQPY